MRWSRRDWLGVLLPPVLAAIFCWPMLRDPLHTFIGVFGGKGDAEGTLWWNWWVETALSDAQRSLWHTDSLFFPIGTAVAPLYGSLLNVLFYYPLLAGLPLPLSNNLWCFFLLMLDGVVAYLVFRALLRRRLPALAGAVIWAFTPFKFMEFRDGHLPQILLTFIPVAAWAMCRLIKRPAWVAAAVAGAALLMDGGGYYQHLYGAFFLASFLTVYGCLHHRRDKPLLHRYLVRQVLVIAIVAAGAAVFYGPLAHSVTVGQDAPWEWPASFPSNQDLRSMPVPQHLMILQWGSLHIILGHEWAAKVETGFFLALAGLALVLGLWFWRKTGFWLASAAFFSLLVAGPVPSLSIWRASSGWVSYIFRNPLYIGFYNWFPSFNRLYWPDTFWPYAVFALAMTILVALRHIKRASLSMALAVLLIVATLAWSAVFVRTTPFIGPFFNRATTNALAARSGAAFIPLPTGSDDYHLPLVVLTGKGMVGGRGRDLEYLEPAAFTELTRDDPALATFARWSRGEEALAPPAAALEVWKERGVRQVVVNRRQCALRTARFAPAGNPAILEEHLRKRLVALLGEPFLADEDWLIFEIP